MQNPPREALVANSARIAGRSARYAKSRATPSAWNTRQQSKSPMKTLTLAKLTILTVLCASLALGQTQNFTITTISGKQYKNATISRVEPDGITVKFSGGLVKIPFPELSKELQEKYRYDPQKAAAAYAAEAASVQRTNQDIEEFNKRAEVEKQQKVEAEKRKALEVSPPAQSAEGVSQQNTENGPHIVGVGGVDGLTVEMGDKHLQLQAAAREEAQTSEEKAARYARNMKTYEGAKQTAARRGLNSNDIVPPRYGQLYYDPFANFK
jgi:hypothetical protein